MSRFQLRAFATACCLPLLAVGCTDDTMGDDEAGPADTSTDESTTDESTTDESTTTDTTTTDTTTTTDESTTDESTTDESTTDESTDTTGGAVCGDSVIDMGEDCEGVDLGGADCVALGHLGGELLCGDDCLFDAAACFDTLCGNGVLDDGEQCDSLEFGPETCADFGFVLGELGCADDCTLIADACTNCGNDVIDAGEACDGGQLDGQTCEGLGYPGGTLSCSAVCDELVPNECIGYSWGEDFETGAVLSAEWVLNGDADWFGSVTTPHAGGFDGESGDIVDNQSSTMQVSLNYSAPGTAQFWYRVSSEEGWDYLRFYIDGVQQAGDWSGIIDWTQSPVYNLAAGAHTLRWGYVKDDSVSEFSDAVWVDDIITTNATLP